MTLIINLKQKKEPRLPSAAPVYIFLDYIQPTNTFQNHRCAQSTDRSSNIDSTP